MPSATKLFLFSLLVLITREYVEAFNETCGSTRPPCVEPLKCIGGYCLCSKIAKTTDEKNPLSFWANGDCHPCPVDYTTTGTKCYSLNLAKGSQLNWDRARERCKERDGDLLVFRSDNDYRALVAVVQASRKDLEMPQRAPHDASYFGSIWIGGKLADWRGNGTFHFVSHGAYLTKKSQHWCSQSSRLGHEPNYVQLKATGERQACVGVAFFIDNTVCMHDWFCSWESYTACEIHPPPPLMAAEKPEALEGKSSGIVIYGIIGIVVLLVLAMVLGVCYCCCRKKKRHRRGRSFDSAESDMSRNSFY